MNDIEIIDVLGDNTYDYHQKRARIALQSIHCAINVLIDANRSMPFESLAYNQEYMTEILRHYNLAMGQEIHYRNHLKHSAA